MTTSARTRIGTLAGGLAAVGLLSGCGLGTAAGYSPSGELAGPVEGIDLEGVSIDVGSKDFTEQIILGEMAVILMQSAGADVQNLTNIPGSNAVREAMLQGALDFQWEYTGTAWLTYLGHEEPIIDEWEQYEAVRDQDREHGMVWLEPSTVDNTYAMAVTQETAEQGITSLSDIAELDEAEQTFCVEAEFAARNDGFEPMIEHYDLPVPEGDAQRTMDSGAIYQATADGACTMGLVFATDGRIPALDLVVLEDDEDFFPRYNLSAVFGEEILEENPELEDLIMPLTERLDNDTMAGLNAQVDVDGEEPADVAWEFLLEEGYVTEGQ
ncbi:glycine betaine ABC transporter substrate-binding protein [Nesterenkonia cremea]|uniref:Glycine/betaine ABC transporter substrate-binding protein n=1 Tax=Nesterenkonia cremea TaxID=1882340 RepID=A0A917AUJ4_9MICC|nr:glycine betaine ABC transporter substrate-binding protein [Nesterenkonia cremea]GGE74048.1 glycine/betaine ABC transporter substrate-binding protein [Nesterenkonia cremea]